MPDDVAAASAYRRRSKAESGEGSGEVVKADKTDLNELEKEKLTTTAGQNLGAKQAKTAPLKQQPNEDLAAYGERVRKQRELEATAGQQADALEKKRKKD